MKYYRRKKQYVPITEVMIPNKKNGFIKYTYYGQGHEGFTCDCIYKTQLYWKPEPFQTGCIDCLNYASTLMCRLVDKETYVTQYNENMLNLFSGE